MIITRRTILKAPGAVIFAPLRGVTANQSSKAAPRQQTSLRPNTTYRADGDTTVRVISIRNNIVRYKFSSPVGHSQIEELSLAEFQRKFPGIGS